MGLPSRKKKVVNNHTNIVAFQCYVINLDNVLFFRKYIDNTYTYQIVIHFKNYDKTITLSYNDAEEGDTTFNTLTKLWRQCQL
jgi:hypothetical protein